MNYLVYIIDVFLKFGKIPVDTRVHPIVDEFSYWNWCGSPPYQLENTN